MEKRQRFLAGGNLCLLFFFWCGNLYIDMVKGFSYTFSGVFVYCLISFGHFFSGILLKRRGVP